MIERKCHYCGHDQFTRGRTIMSSGRQHLSERCNKCGRNFNGPRYPFVPKPEGVDMEQYPVSKNYLESARPCEVCGKVGTELHHWAPRAVFKDEADNWPTGWLCPEHHKEWSDRVKRYFYELARRPAIGQKL